MDMSLFKIENEIRDILDGLSEENSEASLISLTNALIAKTDQVAHFRESLVNYHDLLNGKVLELKNRQVEIINKIEKFDQYILNCMSIHGKEEYTGEFCKIKKRKPSQVVEILDEKLIPIDFIKIPEVKPMIMKAEISKAIKNGELVEGAKLVDGKISLTYSTK